MQAVKLARGDAWQAKASYWHERARCRDAKYACALPMKPTVATRGQVAYVWRKVGDWIAAGDLPKEHAERAVNATLDRFLAIQHSAKGVTLEEWCAAYHASLKTPQDRKEYARRNRRYERARRGNGRR